ncbi:MAG: RNA repair transcriptional activator RtcR family protein [Desulfococcaceae bacterium]
MEAGRSGRRGNLFGRYVWEFPPGEYAIIDLDLSPHDRIAMRFREERRDDISFLKSGIETRNPAFNAPMERIERVAAPPPIPCRRPAPPARARRPRPGGFSS